jgi:O-antigen ligase
MRIDWQQQKLGPLILILVILVVGILLGQVIAGFSFKIALALLFFVIIFFATLVNTEAGLAILIFSMLFSPEIILGQMPGRDIVVRLDDILLAVITFAWFAKTAINKGLNLFIKTRLNRAIVIYILVALIATLKGAALGYVSFLKGSFFLLRYFEYFLLFILVANHIHSKKQIKFFLNAFFVTCALVSLYGIMQIPRGVRVSAPFEGEIGEPNTLGGYILFLFCIAVGIFLQNVSKRTKQALAGLAVLMFIPFLFTLSRASYLAIIFSYLVLIILSKRKVILIGVLATIIVSVLMFRPEAVFSRVKYTFSGGQSRLVKIGNTRLDSSSSARIRSWQESFEDWKKNPILGRGVSGYGFIDGQYIVNLVETGVVGLFVFLWLLWSIYKHSLGIHREVKDDLYKGLTLGFLAGFVGLTIHALTANTFIIIRIMEPFWFVAALVMMLPQIEKEEEEKRKEPKANASEKAEREGILNEK